MKSLIKHLQDVKLNYKQESKNIIHITLNENHTWINGYGETMTRKAFVRVYKLESYKTNNYGVSWSTGYSTSEKKEVKTVKEVKDLVNKLIKL